MLNTSRYSACLLIPTYGKTHLGDRGRLVVTTGRGVKLIDALDAALEYGVVDIPVEMICHEGISGLIIGADTAKDILNNYPATYSGEIIQINNKHYIRVPVDSITVSKDYNGTNYYIFKDNYSMVLYNGPDNNLYVLGLSNCNYSVGSALQANTISINSLANNSTSCNNQEINKPKRKEQNKMNFNFNNLFGNIQFGKASRNFALSFDNHIAYKGKYYDNGALNDACGLTLDLDGLLYVMPVQEIKKGDIVIKEQDAFYYDGQEFISLTTGMKAEYVPTKVLNMTFYCVVKNLAGNLFAGNQANASNPMGNLLPFLLLGKDNDSDDLVKFMLLSQGGFNLFGAASAPAPADKK